MYNYLILYFLIAYLIHGWVSISDWVCCCRGVSRAEVMWLIFAPLSLIVYAVVFVAYRNLE